MIPYANATLTKIVPLSASDDYEDVATEGTPRWESTVGVYVIDERVELQSGDAVNEVIQTRVEVPWRVGKLIERGDRLTYTDENGDVQERAAGTLTSTVLAGRVRVLLEDQ